VVSRPWVPRASEIVRIDFNPTKGHEQANDRPAVVLSNQGFNDKSGLLVCIPCTTKIKGNPFEVRISGLNGPTVALSHQIRTMDWRERGAVFIGVASAAEMAEILGKIQSLIGIR
jgi:mRNA interferase MazF